MKILKLMLFILVLGLISVSGNGNVYAATNVISEHSYKEVQLDDATLYKMALQGDLVNNENTQVNVSYQDDNKIQVVKITKRLNQKVLNDGKIIENYSVAVTGKKEEDAESGSRTVGLTAGFHYEKNTFNGMFCYKATDFYSVPDLMDKSFSLSSLSQDITASGQGYTENGFPVTIKDSKSQGTFTNPSKGKVYLKSTGFQKYIYQNDGSGIGTIATLGYKRNSTGKLGSFELKVNL